jgi:hypothetical protein
MLRVPEELETMATFDPSEPAILHDSLTDEIETWTGEDAAGYRKNAVLAYHCGPGSNGKTITHSMPSL